MHGRGSSICVPSPSIVDGTQMELPLACMGDKGGRYAGGAASRVHGCAPDLPNASLCQRRMEDVRRTPMKAVWQLHLRV